MLTGSLPSMASSHSFLLDSDSACSVITPCLGSFRRKAGLSMISWLWGPWAAHVYTSWFNYKRTSGTKIACVQMPDFKPCPRSALCFTIHSQLKKPHMPNVSVIHLLHPTCSMIFLCVHIFLHSAAFSCLTKTFNLREIFALGLNLNTASSSSAKYWTNKQKWQLV